MAMRVPANFAAPLPYTRRADEVGRNVHRRIDGVGGIGLQNFFPIGECSLPTRSNGLAARSSAEYVTYPSPTLFSAMSRAGCLVPPARSRLSHGSSETDRAHELLVPQTFPAYPICSIRSHRPARRSAANVSGSPESVRAALAPPPNTRRPPCCTQLERARVSAATARSVSVSVTTSTSNAPRPSCGRANRSR